MGVDLDAVREMTQGPVPELYRRVTAMFREDDGDEA
jgi:hypothetical protein